MSAIEDTRKLLQDLVTPELRELKAQIAAGKEATQLRFDAADANLDEVDARLSAKIDHVNETLSAKIDQLDLKFMARTELILARMESQHMAVLNALSIDKRLDHLERQAKSAEPTAA